MSKYQIEKMDPSECKTKDDVLFHLVSNLTYIYEDKFAGEYRQVLGFRRSFSVSQVWRNRTSGTWAYHVSEDAFDGVANIGEYDTFGELLDRVADVYAKLWNIVD